MLRIVAAFTAVLAMSACSIDHPTKPPMPTKDVPAPTQKQNSAPTAQGPAQPQSPVPQTMQPGTASAGDERPSPAAAAMATNVPLFADLLCGEYSSKGSASALPANLAAPRTRGDKGIYALAQQAKTAGEQKFFLALLADSKLIYLKDANGRGLFHWLAVADATAIANDLTEAGIRTGLLDQDNDGNIPMHLVTSAKMVDVLWSSEQIVVNNKKAQTPLIAMAEAKSPALKEAGWMTCVRFGAISTLRGMNPLNAVDELGRTALHYAAINGDVNGIDGLRSCDNADLSTTDRWSRTPLHYAVLANDGGGAINALASADLALAWTMHLASRLDLEAKDANGQTALDLAKNLADQRVTRAITSLYEGK